MQAIKALPGCGFCDHVGVVSACILNGDHAKAKQSDGIGRKMVFTSISCCMARAVSQIDWDSGCDNRVNNQRLVIVNNRSGGVALGGRVEGQTRQCERQ